MYELLWLYGPFMYENFWLMLIVNIHRLPNDVLNNYLRNFYNIFIRHFPEYA